MGGTEAERMNWCSKRGIVKASESPAGSHAGHTAWGLCSETVSSQGLISPTLSFHPCFTLPVKSLTQHLPTFSYRWKNSLPLLCIQLHTGSNLHISTTAKKEVQSDTLASFMLIQCKILNSTLGSKISIPLFFDCFILFQKYVLISKNSKKSDIFRGYCKNRCWKSLRCLGISSCHLKQF